jgi:hypothetical protein
VLTLLIGGIAAQFLPKNRLELIETVIDRIPVAAQGALVGALIVAIDSLGPTGIAPFIYFQF